MNNNQTLLDWYAKAKGWEGDEYYWEQLKGGGLHYGLFDHNSSDRHLGVTIDLPFLSEILNMTEDVDCPDDCADGQVYDIIAVGLSEGFITCNTCNGTGKITRYLIDREKYYSALGEILGCGEIGMADTVEKIWLILGSFHKADMLARTEAITKSIEGKK